MQSEIVARGVTVMERLRRLDRITKDPEVKKGLQALLRTGVNLGISAADVAPLGIGEVASWTADVCKMAGRYFNINLLDTTPDVSSLIAVGTEAVEMVTGGIAPSHAIESSLQLKADWPRMKNALTRASEHWSGEAEKSSDHALTEAIEVFDKTS